MKYLVIVLLLLTLAGCTVNRAFVRQVDTHTTLILPEYQAYVAADAALGITSKRIRIQSCQALLDLIETAKVEAGINAN